MWVAAEVSAEISSNLSRCRRICRDFVESAATSSNLLRFRRICRANAELGGIASAELAGIASAELTGIANAELCRDLFLRANFRCANFTIKYSRACHGVKAVAKRIM